MKIRPPRVAWVLAFSLASGCAQPIPETNLTPGLQQALQSIFSRADSILVYEVSDGLWWPKEGVDTVQVIGNALLSSRGAPSPMGYPVESAGRRLTVSHMQELSRVCLDQRGYLRLQSLCMFEPLIGLEVFAGQEQYDCLIDFRCSQWVWQTTPTGGRVGGHFGQVKKRLAALLGGVFEDNGRMARLMNL